ncbi:lipid droplet-associated hydrolase [Cataglyphis hispanica]|uniref:lipid droplet-associated hydrolase n=1 Tax=Cataglyphis hispanica TaxID=1086592 RepID=UPI0021803B49|nr:lipid droplet-associated hydrolase [Cataglyphis hispanica]
MRQSMINCNQVQTQVITEGRWIEEDSLPQSSKHVVLVIPGNPGVPRFYEEFIKALYSRLTLDTPVWIIGHAGHVQPPDNLEIAMPSDEKWAECYSLNAQIQHKVEFIKKYIPEDAQLHLIGHSIGAWFVLNLLKNNDINGRIKKCYMLFPTVEYMADSPNGILFCNFVSRIAPVLIFLSWIFTEMFPVSLQSLMIRIFGIFWGIPARSVKAVQEMLNPKVLSRIINLAREEMKYVKEADDKIISKHNDKLWFYYGANDGWTPQKYYKNMISKHPNLNVQLCQRGFQHSFVLKNDVEMGHIVGDLINEELRH